MQLGRATSQALQQAWRHLPGPTSLGQAMFLSTSVEASTATQLSWGLRALRTAGFGVAVTAVVIPAGAVAALVVSGRDDADAIEIFQAVPRTLRVLWWSLWAAYHYKALAASFAAAAITEESYRRDLGDLHRLAAARLLRVCQTNGGVYVKAGQLMVSMQAVPVEYREVLEALEDHVPPRPFSVIDRVICRELGASAHDVFAEFNPSATAAASLAQVHRARTKDGMEVAVKVQYPGLESAVSADLATITALASLAAFLFRSDWRFMFSELRAKLTQEMDFSHEAGNAARLASYFSGRRDVAVPRLFPELSTRKILCMEWIDGVKVSDVAALRRLHLSPRQVGLTLMDTAAEMMSVHGFVHGDLHPGNVFVRALPRRGPPILGLLPWFHRPRPQIVLLDHGLYFELPAEMRQLYCMMWCAFVLHDAATAQAAGVQLAGERAGKALPQFLKPRDWSKMSVEERRGLREEMGVSGFGDLTRALNEAPRQLVDCLRAMALVRHTASRLGVSVADRLRVNATQALRGLQVAEESAAAGHRGRVVYIGVMRSRWKRWRLWVHIAAMRLVAWAVVLVGEHAEPEVPVPALAS